jgi:hypothetical protein
MAGRGGAASLALQVLAGKAVYRHQVADEITSAATMMDSIFGEAKGS